MRDYYAEFLQTKNSVNTSNTEVSKVSKGQKVITQQPFDTFDTALTGVNQKDNFPQKMEELVEIKFDYLHSILKRFFEDGIKFEVSADDFQVIDDQQILKTSDREFLEINSSDVLCHLQQSLLMKHLFSHSPFLLDDFAFEIKERESIFTEGAGVINYEQYCMAVKDVTRNWFERLIE